jgi:hypothetical protein
MVNAFPAGQAAEEVARFLERRDRDPSVVGSSGPS